MMASLFDLLGGDKETSKSIVGSLFGLSPELVAQQQAQSNLQASQNTAMQYAQMDPMQRAQYAMFQGASGASSGLMGAIGPESAQVQRAKQEMALRQAMADKGISLDNPKGFAEASKLAMEMNLPDIAAKMGMAGAQLDKEQATAEKARFLDADKKADIAIYSKFLQQAGGDEAKAAMAFNDYKQKQAIEQKVAGRTVVSVTNQQESEFSKTLGKIQGDQMKGAYDTRNAAVKTLDTLSKMSNLNDQQLISGSFSGPRAAAANFLNTVGLASPADAKRLANTQQFEKVANDLVLSNIKQLGYNPSNADVIFLNKTLPNLEASPEARKSLINWMATKAQGSIAEVKNMEQYAIKNKSLNGYTPVVPNFNPTGGVQPTALQGMSDDELAAAIKAKKKGNQ